MATLMLAPALLAAGGYLWWFGLPLRAGIAATDGQIRAVQAALPSAAQIGEVHQRADALRAELAVIAAQRQPTTPLGGAVFVPSPERARWRLLLSDTLQRHRLAVMTEERTELDLPATIARGLTGLALPRTQVSAWSLQVRGGYLDLLAAITELRAASIRFHLLELGMRRDAAGQLIWTMVVG